MSNLKAPFGVRMPEELKEWLRRQSQVSRRSLNNEIIKRLEESKAAQESQVPA